MRRFELLKGTAGKSSRMALLVVGLLLLGTLPAFSDRVWWAFAIDYGSAYSTFGLALPPFPSVPTFDVPVQGNASADLILSTTVEYAAVRTGPFELGLAAKGAFGLSSWNLGVPAAQPVIDSLGYVHLYDEVHIGADWWALAAMGTMHLHLGQFVTWDAAVGYGPYGYFDVTYYDDDGVVSGPVSGSSSVFPPHSWSIDWSTGFTLIYWRRVGFLLSIGSMGPDFFAGLGVKYAF